MFQTVDEYGIAVGGEIEVQFLFLWESHNKRQKA
jgi:hypothetical protein